MIEFWKPKAGYAVSSPVDVALLVLGVNLMKLKTISADGAMEWKHSYSSN